ncbi:MULTISPECIES: maleylpyruvate isomerase family mycothiol-dependent enzyme [unclassified Streptomyces]|uniref:maleylpyruvate isomerase family mycothiol-dependent enzyme n=1 Tax=unclassified Streptomyces TaxID=2593676 RepID=UPI00093CFF07|nr:maleylpyruvate isomerase family mycothiol-dependent enzyme [Streptomyces sp. TSRI0281]
MTETLDTARLVAGLREQTGAFTRAVAGRDPDAAVPTCPQWRLRTLVGHVGQEHRWAAELIRTGAQLPVPDPRQADPGAPDGWAGWLREGAEELIRAIEETGPDTETHTFLGPRPAAFCLRRMLSDTCVHHYDAAFATGTPFEVADDLAADVISESLDLLSASAFERVAPTVAELRGRGERIGFRPRFTDGWVITRTPEALRWVRGPVEADVVVSGAVADLMLVFSRRVPPEDDRVTVTGDRALLNHWLARAVF